MDTTTLRAVLKARAIRPAGLVARGAEVDGGMTAEAVLISLIGARLRPEACTFARRQIARSVFEEISALKDRLVEGLARLAEGAPVPRIGELIHRLRPPAG